MFPIYGEAQNRILGSVPLKFLFFLNTYFSLYITFNSKNKYLFLLKDGAKQLDLRSRSRLDRCYILVVFKKTEDVIQLKLSMKQCI